MSRIFYRCVDWNNKKLKQNLVCVVASFTDAWIETLLIVGRGGEKLSHLLQMRGLKLWVDREYSLFQCRIFYRCVDWNVCRLEWKVGNWRSHLLQMRGLKPCGSCIICRKRKSHLLQMRGLKLSCSMLMVLLRLSHLLQMRGLKRYQRE